MKISWSGVGPIGLQCALWRQPNTDRKHGTDRISDYQQRKDGTPSCAIRIRQKEARQTTHLSKPVLVSDTFLQNCPLQPTNHTKLQSQIALALSNQEKQQEHLETLHPQSLT